MVGVGELAALVKAGDLDADRELTRLAARGDFQAQRELLTILIGEPDELYERSFEDVLRVELLARFIALRGNVLDVRRLAGVLWQMGRKAPDAAARNAFATEAVALLRNLADDGDGVASEHLAALAADFPDEWAAAELGDAQPPIIRSAVCERTLGDILAAVLASSAVQQPRGLLGRAWDSIADLYWRARLSLSALGSWR